MKRFFFFIVVCIMLISCFAGCSDTDVTDNTEESGETVAGDEGSTADADSGQTDGEYDPDEEEYLIIDSNNDTADAFESVWWLPTDPARLMLFDCLLQCDKEGNPNIDMLAESHSVSDDGLTYSFTVRTDVKWHDGEAFTAEDFEWSVLTALKASKLNAILTTQLGNIEGAQEYIDGTANGVSGLSVDGNTITVKLAEPSNMFLVAVSQFAPLPKHLLEGEAPETVHTSEYWQFPIGTGPYKFKEFVVGEYFEFERNDDYYGSKAIIKKVKALLIDAEDYVIKTQANELDYCQTRDPDTVEAVTENTNYTAVLFPVVYSRQFSFNMRGYNGADDGDTAVSDIRVRQALNYALDISAICEAIYGDYATPIYSYIAPNIIGYTDDVQKYEYDPEKAKELLDEAGFDYSHTIRILEYWGDSTTHDLLDLIVYYFDQIGVKAEWFNAGTDATAAINEVRDYDINLNAYNCGAYTNMVYSILTNLNTIRVDEDTDFDTLYAELCAETDFDQQLVILKELQQTESKYCFTIPMCTLKYFYLVNEAKLNTEGVNFLGDGFNYDRGFDKLSFNPDYFN